METKENLHDGHRQRLINKLVTARDTLADHELLESLLFFSIPRKDVNPLAHRLLNTFNGLNGVFKATKSQLMSISGIGDKSAELILLVGEFYSRSLEEKKKRVSFNNNDTIRRELKNCFKLDSAEASVLIILDKEYKKLCELTYKGKNSNEVEIDLNEITRVFSAFHPTFAILAHSHPNGSCFPSLADDVVTGRLAMLCSIHGITLLEHIIFKGEEYYSYRSEGRLDMLKAQTDLKKLLKNGGEYNE